MRSAHFIFWVLPLLPLSLLTSCQGPKVTVVVNRLKPGMLKGKTVGLEGMVITAANWPGQDIDTPILSKAEKVLQRGLKGARVCLLNEAGSVHESAAKSSSKTASKEPDYIFRIMLRADSVSHVPSQRMAVGSGRLTSYRDPGFHAFGGWSRSNDYSFPLREVTKRTLKADYILSDARTYKLIWRAEAVTSAKYVELAGSGTSYRTASVVEAEVPLEPLWVSMNTAAVRTIRK
jgi:hypothetical protein